MDEKDIDKEKLNFGKDDYKSVAENVPGKDVSDAFDSIKNIKDKEKDKEEER